METQTEQLINTLKEQGAYDIKPFNMVNYPEQLWGFCVKKNNHIAFLVCDSTLKFIQLSDFFEEKYDEQFEFLDKELFYKRSGYCVIRVSDDAYSLLSVGEAISQTSEKGWLVDNRHIIINDDVLGYKIVGHYLIASPRFEMITNSNNDTFGLKPEEKSLMYELKHHFFQQHYENLEKNKMKYCASFGRTFHIGFSNGKYFVFNDEDRDFKYADSFIVNKGDVFLVRYKVEKQELIWEAFEYKAPRYRGDDEQIVKIKTGIKTDSLDDCQIEWCCSQNYFALTSFQEKTNIKELCFAHWEWKWGESSFDRSKIWYLPTSVLLSKPINNSSRLVKVGNNNGVFLLEGQDGSYRIGNTLGKKIAGDVPKEIKYAIIKDFIIDTSHLISKNGLYKLYGVIRMEDLSVVVPMRYQEIIIQSTNPDLFVLARTDYMDVSKYELLKNGEVIFPKATTDCEIYGMESDKIVLIKQGGKYGLLYFGEQSIPVEYDRIENSEPNVYLTLTKGDSTSLYVIESNYLSKNYKNIKVVSTNPSKGRVCFIGDEKFIIIENGIESIIVDDNTKKFCNSDDDSRYFVFVLDEREFDGYEFVEKYICYDTKGNTVDMEIDYCHPSRINYQIDHQELYYCPTINSFSKTPYYYEENYDNRSFGKYGGYNGYDDETIDEAFEGDPSLTWNVD